MRGNLCVVLHGRQLRVRHLRVRHLRVRQLGIRYLYSLNSCRLLHGRQKTPQAADVKQRKPVEVAVVKPVAIKLENPNPILGLHIHRITLAHIKCKIPFIKLTND